MYLLKFTVLCFGSEFAFDLLDESETANCNCFRPCNLLPLNQYLVLVQPHELQSSGAVQCKVQA